MYMDEMARLIGHRCEMDASIPESMRLLRIYALLGFAKGVMVTSKDVHDAWSIWRAETRPDHPALVEWAALTPEVRGLDDQYRDAIHWSARALGMSLP